MDEVIALVQQGLAGGPGQSVGEAVAEVQSSRVPAALAKGAIGQTCEFGVLPGDRLGGAAGVEVDEGGVLVGSTLWPWRRY